jgi:hypothetical protein
MVCRLGYRVLVRGADLQPASAGGSVGKELLLVVGRGAAAAGGLESRRVRAPSSHRYECAGMIVTPSAWDGILGDDVKAG